MIIHLGAFWLFLYGFQTLGFLHDYAFFNPAYAGINEVNFPGRYKADKTVIEQVGNFGLALAYVISWFVCSRKNWHWINGLIIFVLAFALGNLHWFGWNHLYKIFLAPGRPFHFDRVWKYCTDGLFMVALGLLLLLLKPVIRFIDKGNPEHKRKVAADKIARRVV
jgi:hypothetical protein